MDQFPTFEEIRSSILRDTLSLDPAADTHEGSDHFVHASRLASCAEGQYAHQAWVLRQFFADTADTQYLERHCNLRGLRRKNATFASGTATVYGVVNSNVPAGLQVKCGALFFITTVAAKVAANGRIMGLPDVNKAYFDLNIKYLQSGSKDLVGFLAKKTIPNSIQLPSQFSAKGIFKGTIATFNTNMDIVSSFGNAKIKATFDQSRKNYEKYDAETELTNFRIGKYQYT